ncbi:Formamidopyrimidine-DNA glycosylase N-terminal domain-containing protein [Hypoxylon rubiginosum]|uniref:Formamidopyrimidine-DNA glycosylase N-terminal domain-containing protein n=1 Tax=Hypoxylon rubiginosum TaxID=110542 RepID=A0ACC0D755_9PEZI|nr:Formamidopyrimidine-DNA glycosylase N-terminal domain-containing protein [Hypoxylon rubiginosum]
MPEIAEVARVVHFLRLHLVGKTISKVAATDDGNVFGKVGTSGPAFAAALTGKTVVDVGSQGKYFWMVLSGPPHPVMHLGMTGWVQIRGVQTGYTRYVERTKGQPEEWPPKYWKFHLETETDGSNPKVEVAFTDSRRFGRIRLVDCPGQDIRKHSPLVENGPDPVVDKDVFTEAFLRQKMRSRHVPIKALLLDQSTISGIGNWVGDEILYQAKLHPEQYCDDFDDADVATLYKAIRYVCQTAVDVLGDSDRFPADWMFNHRWGKGKKDSPTTLPSGEKIIHITVGGRTSCVVPSVQKKRGRTTIDDVKEEEESVASANGTESRFFDDKKKKRVNGNGKTKAKTEPEERPSKKAKTAKSKAAKQEEAEDEPKSTPAPAPKASRKSSKPKKEEKPIEPSSDLGRRRSSRLSRISA